MTHTLAGAKTCVTGGAGFIGSELVRELADLGAWVSVVDNLTTGRRSNLEGLSPERVVLHVADIRDPEAMATLLKGIDIVFHLACLGVRHSIHSPQENHDVNASGTLNVLMAARRSGVPRFIHVSTSEVYGTARVVPMTEEHPTLPSTVYGASKLAGECYALAFHRTYGYSTTVVRPFNAYGPRSHHESDSGEVIPRFLIRCLAGQPMVVFGDGSQTRDFTHVTDTARGLVLVASTKTSVGQTVNLGSGHEISIVDLARKVAQVTGRKDARIEHREPRPGDTLRLYADITRARALVGFAPTVSFEEGLTQLRNWYLESPSSPSDLLAQEQLVNWERK